MMIDYDYILTSPLFKGMGKEEVKSLAGNIQYTVQSYEKDEIILEEGDPMGMAYFVHIGSVRTFFEVAGGRKVNVSVLESPSAISQDSLFASESSYPVTAVAMSKTIIVQISIAELMKALQESPSLLKNYLSYVSNKHQRLTSRMRILLIKTIPQKLAYYILDLAGDVHDSVVLPMSQTNLADYLAVTRPSLARGLRQLSELKLINYKTRTIYILDREKLVELLDV
ncbi:MAG: Crp/Fnr family transcriptional regulator [Mangrovibacterium sp.]